MQDQYRIPEIILDEVAYQCAVTRSDLLGKRRTKRISEARQLAMSLCRSLTKLSLQQIGSIFNRDHSTVLRAIQQAEQDSNAHSRLVRLCVVGKVLGRADEQ
jgi:chromosomal replication initiator protein